MKLRWLKKGIPAVKNFGEEPQGLAFDSELLQTGDETPSEDTTAGTTSTPKKVVPPKQDEFIWAWKVRLLHRGPCHTPNIDYSSLSWKLQEGLSSYRDFIQTFVSFRFNLNSADLNSVFNVVH